MAKALKKADIPDELPIELQQLIELKQAIDKERIDALATIVTQRRKEAIDARAASNIERVWQEDEEYYLGIDDENRAS